MLALRCGAQNYEWGRHASNSEVAKLAKANGSEVDESKPFAELWMGTHKNCPSTVASTGESLQSWIETHPACLGLPVQQRFGVHLPFLFKVLSVAKALSIQSHPDKQLAEKLHNQQPKLYPDDNHKPEMALAMTNFEALCGFCPLEELQEALREVPELVMCIGEQATNAVLKARQSDPQVLKAAFTALMTCEPSRVQEAIKTLVGRLEKQQQQCQGTVAAKEALAVRLNSQYPGGDVGVLSCFFFNLIHLKPGQAIYLPANVPHAYLDGEILECMAASDNVIRAGLSPKFKDVEVLCSSLLYEQGMPEVLEGLQGDLPGYRVYRPPFEEFEIHAMEVAAGSDLAIPPSSGPRILLVESGPGSAKAQGSLSQASELKEEMAVGKGSILFIPAGTQVSVSANAGTEPLKICGAAVNSTFLQLSEALHAPEQLQPGVEAAVGLAPVGSQ